MANKQKQFDIQFKKDAVKFCEDHPDMIHAECAAKLGVGNSTLARWKREYKNNNNEVQFRGSGNFSSDLEKENARLRRELKNTQKDIFLNLAFESYDSKSAMIHMKVSSRIWMRTNFH
ncbi:transposase [Faecalicoccus pleomorphus]|uniref:transposase n=2 Tax=Faecalicoccus pleomorphus TaxID=1323 RepID=UPI001960F7C9|nr:transposase [Faecalicoccus pleomorphus]